MKFKLIPTERRIVRQFKPLKVEVSEAESEIKRLIALSTDKFKGKAIPAILHFDDGSGAGELTSKPVPFQEGSSTNVSYYAVQMLSERYGAASQELKDVFLNQLYETLATEEKIVPTTKRLERPSMLQSLPQKTCLTCGEEIAAKMGYCPYCGESQAPAPKTNPQPLPEPVVEELPSTPDTEGVSSVSLVEALKEMIATRELERRAKVEASIQSNYEREKSKRLAQKIAELATKTQKELDEAKRKYEEQKQLIEQKATENRETEIKHVEAALYQEMAEEIDQARAEQKQSAQALIQGLNDFLEGSSNE